MTCGLIGRRLGHSYSPQIHRALADYDYKLWELEPEELETFFRHQDFTGVNVTIPYKQAVIPLLDELSETARAIGAVNTVVRRGGKLYGDNTDFVGMAALIRHIGLSLEGKKVLILGTGGTSKTAVAVARSLGAAEVYRLSRSGRDGALTYEDAARLHADADVLINTTPAGCIPPSKAAPLPSTPSRISAASWTPSIIPCARTSCCRRARAGSPPRAGSTCSPRRPPTRVPSSAAVRRRSATLTSPIRPSAARWRTSSSSACPPPARAPSATPSRSGLGKRFADSDALVTERIGMPIADYFAQRGEAAFREREQEAVADLAATGGQVIATVAAPSSAPKT